MSPSSDPSTAERPPQWPTQALMAAGLLAGALFSKGKVGKMALAVAAGSVIWRSMQKHVPQLQVAVKSPRQVLEEEKPAVPVQWPAPPQREIPLHWAGFAPAPAPSLPVVDEVVVAEEFARNDLPQEAIPRSPLLDEWMEQEEPVVQEPFVAEALDEVEVAAEVIAPVAAVEEMMPTTQPTVSIHAHEEVVAAEPDMSAVNWAIMAPTEPALPALAPAAPVAQAPEPLPLPLADWLQEPLFKERPTELEQQVAAPSVAPVLVSETVVGREDATPTRSLTPHTSAPIVAFSAAAESFLILEPKPAVPELEPVQHLLPEPSVAAATSSAWLLDVAPVGIAEEEEVTTAHQPAQADFIALGGDLPDVIEITGLTAPVPLPAEPQPVAAAPSWLPAKAAAVQPMIQEQSPAARPATVPLADTEHKLLSRILSTEEPVARPPSTPLLKPILQAETTTVAATLPEPSRPATGPAVTASELTRAKQWNQLLEQEHTSTLPESKPQPVVLTPRMRPSTAPLLSTPAAAALPPPVQPVEPTVAVEVKPSQDLKKTLPITLGPALQPLPDALAKLIPSVAQAGSAEGMPEAAPTEPALPLPVTPAAPLFSQPQVREIREELPADAVAESIAPEMPTASRPPLSIRVALKERASQRLPGLTPIRLNEPREPSGPIHDSAADAGSEFPDLPSLQQPVSNVYDRPANAAKTTPVRLIPRAPASDAADKKKQWLGWWK